MQNQTSNPLDIGRKYVHTLQEININYKHSRYIGYAIRQARIHVKYRFNRSHKVKTNNDGIITYNPKHINN